MIEVFFIQEEKVLKKFELSSLDNLQIIKKPNGRNFIKIIQKQKNTSGLQLLDIYNVLSSIKNYVNLEIWIKQNEIKLFSCSVIKKSFYKTYINKNNLIYEQLFLYFYESDNQIKQIEQYNLFICDKKCKFLDDNILFCKKYACNLFPIKNQYIFPCKGCYLEQKYLISDKEIIFNMEQLMEKVYGK